MKLRGATVLVIGASGFVGGHVARRLAVEEGMAVRALVRRPGGRTVVDLGHTGIEVVRGDLLDPASLAAACTGADLVFHAAADMTLRDWDTAWATTVEGTGNLFEATRAGGARRFIFVSSIDVYLGLDRYEGEDVPIPPYGDLYADSKLAAEALLLDAADPGPEVVIFRPPAVYGPGGPEWTVGMMRNALKGLVLLPAGGRFPFPYVYIDNLADAVVAAAQADRAGGVYNVIDGRVPYREFTAFYTGLAGRRPISVPGLLLRGIALGADLYGRLAGKWVLLSRKRVHAVLRCRRHGQATSEKLERDLGWKPRVDLTEGMGRTEAWLREAGYIGREGS